MATLDTAPSSPAPLLPEAPAPTGEPFNAAEWLVTRHARATPDRRAITAIDLDGTVRTLSYAELDAAVTACSAALVAAGIRPEERLLLCMGDCPELLTAFLAGLRVGAVPVPVSTMLTPKDIAVLATDSRARLVLLSAEFAALGSAVAGSRDLTDVVVLTDGDLPEVPGARVRTWAEFTAAGADFAGQVAEPYPTVADSPAFWLYTSGTTGTPKGAMHRHGSLRDTAETYARDVLAIGPDDVTFSVAKFFFAYGLGNTLTFPFSVGASTVLDRSRPSPAGTLRVLREQRPTLFFAGPTYYAALLAAGLPADAFAGVRACVSAGEAFPAALFERFTGTFGVEMLDGIGSTEMLHIFISGRPGRTRPGSTGEVVAGYEARILDDDGQPVPDGTPGNLWVKGSSAATGYWSRTAVTRRVFQGEWVRTGDTYVRSADGFYSSLGRTDDIIKAGGIWVSPTEVEERLRAHGDVAQVVVVSVPDETGLDKPVACVVLTPGAAAGPEDLVAWCRDGLAAFKRPRHIVVFDELPTTATGKLQRFRIRELAVERLGGAARPDLTPVTGGPA
ncbi:AMP-binding enzyme C-terminal domain-containing protein [Geodermatophilus telluris]|uniref:AMP-binding enzyme C-terminal domain-containing protein n=1 Tax=Geodermatophilus telluris TaxID=1190417 RepID=A0A1G6V1T0_9ACTN|nr:benzoate-CoA ligase family protein [Geodermatophilus telluris]SDD46906.1 AMP-binding enzyme C-terminal domain-containing protein [Geodermatophilus telluris]